MKKTIQKPKPVMSWQASAWGIGLLLVLGALMWCIYSTLRPKIVYVNTETVFASFDLTKSLRTRLENTHSSRMEVLQALNGNLQAMQAREASMPHPVRRDSIEVLFHSLQKKETSFSKDQETETRTYDTQIWTQLETYFEAYRQANGYDLILGSNGTQGVLAGSRALDKTDEVIAFINRQYSGTL